MSDEDKKYYATGASLGEIAQKKQSLRDEMTRYINYTHIVDVKNELEKILKICLRYEVYCQCLLDILESNDTELMRKAVNTFYLGYLKTKSK